MNNVIPPLQNIPISPTKPDNGLTATVDGPNSQLNNLKPGDNISLQLRSMSMGKMLAAIKLNPQSPLTEISLSINKTLDLPQNTNLKITARVIAQNLNGTELKILNINNQKPELFIKTDISSNLPHATIKPSNIINSPPINVTNNTDKINLPPIKLDSIIAPLVKDLPPTVAKQIVDGVQNLQLKPELKLQGMVPEKISLPPSTSNQPIEKFLPDLKLSLDSLKTAIEGKSPTQVNDLVGKFIENIKTAIPNLVGKNIPAEIIGKDQNIIINTEIGKIIPDQQLKIPAEIKLNVQITEILNNNSAYEKPSIQPLTTSLLDIIKPIKNADGSDLYQQIINKIPAANNKMLPNIVSFMKATSEQTIDSWLGKELITKLNSLGVEGKEILAKLDNLLIPKNQEQQTWRIIEVPFFNQDNLSKIKIAVRNMDDDENSEKEKKNNNKSARFVVDTSFTALGNFQFDGFSIPQEKRFDLIIRTQNEFSEDFVSSVMQIFRQTLAELDYAGNIKINVKENFIKVFDDEKNVASLPNGIFI